MTFMGCVASYFVVTLIAFFLDTVGKIAYFVQIWFYILTFCTILILGRTMSWYGRPWWIFFLYMTPTVMSVTAVFSFALPQQKKVLIDESHIFTSCTWSYFQLQYFQFADGIWVIESLYFEVSKLVWTLFTLVMTVLGLKSSFFCMIWVFFPMIGRFILERVYGTCW